MKHQSGTSSGTSSTAWYIRMTRVLGPMSSAELLRSCADFGSKSFVMRGKQCLRKFGCNHTAQFACRREGVAVGRDRDLVRCERGAEKSPEPGHGETPEFLETTVAHAYMRNADQQDAARRQYMVQVSDGSLEVKDRMQDMRADDAVERSTGISLGAVRSATIVARGLEQSACRISSRFTAVPPKRGA